VSIATFHAEWLNLLEIDGPFLTLPVLTERLRSGLEPTDPDLVAELHTAQREVEDDPTLQPVWSRWVITRLLGFPDEVLREGASIGPSLTHRVAEHSQTLRPDFAVVERADDGTERARLIVNLWPAGTDLAERPVGERWAASPIDRTAELCRATSVRLGLVTNGDTWTLVDAPVDGTTGTATWDATLWAEERTTLDAFVTLLGVRRFFTVADSETLEALLAQSANAEAEVTDQLGKQVRAAVELLVDAMSRADRERGGTVFQELAHAELDQDLEPFIYEAAVTVLMRLVFLLSAEERGLFLLGDPTYDATYAVSTLLAQLEEDANRYGEDVLERRTDAWHRLLATFRMVHAGAAHVNLRLPPYGGSLFDPDRFPFLEGRRLDHPAHEPATPLRIDNRTIKHILDALQVLRFRGKGGWQEARRLSFRTLGVEQIGHVYEGLLDHGVVQVSTEAVALTGKTEPEVALALVEEAAARGHDALINWLAELTGEKPPTIQKTLAAVVEPDQLDRLASACENDPELAARVAPYLGLLRTDLRGLPQVYLADSYYVTKSSDRRSSGAYYTPRALAEEMVTHTLEPLVYAPGPVDGLERADWKLKGSIDLLGLRVCDMAMGSGAFLVAACRYLSERVLEAWDAEGLIAGQPVRLPGGSTITMPDDETDREVLARRLVADRCLYGVDRNPMAVEMAKLSMWLVTLAKDRPFTFVDHALRCGDSLLGVTDLQQLSSFHLDPSKGRVLHGGTLFDPAAQIEPLVKAALEKRRQLESFTVIDLADADTKRRLLEESAALLDDLKIVADLVVGAALSTSVATEDAGDSRLASVAADVTSALALEQFDDARAARLYDLRLKATYWLDQGRPALGPARRCFHWILEFPEVFLDHEDARFDAVIGNPPFLGGKRISGAMGSDFREHAVRWIAGGRTGSCDLSGYFFLRAATLSRRFGLLSTGSIAQGDTRLVTLEPLLQQRWVVDRAVKSVPWPGEAAVVIAKLWMNCLGWVGPATLDDRSVRRISSLLEPGDVVGEPHSLGAKKIAFQGTVLNGNGFLVDQSEYERLVEADSRNREVLIPFLSGDDINNHPEQEATRWAINFFDWSLEGAQEFPECLAIVRARVKPYRDTVNRKAHRERWWIYGDKRPLLYDTIRDMKRVTVMARASWVLQPSFAAVGHVFGDKLVVFALEESSALAVVASSIHDAWARARMKPAGVPTYSPADCFETFPLPDRALVDGGRAEALVDHRRVVMLERKEGLTKVYNRVHNPTEIASDIEDLRRLHDELDRAVVEAYGWADLNLNPGFYETRQGVRYTIDSAARADVLARVLELNHARYTDEVARGASGRRPRSAPNRGRSAGSQLF